MICCKTVRICPFVARQIFYFVMFLSVCIALIRSCDVCLQKLANLRRPCRQFFPLTSVAQHENINVVFSKLRLLSDASRQHDQSNDLIGGNLLNNPQHLLFYEFDKQDPHKVIDNGGASSKDAEEAEFGGDDRGNHDDAELEDVNAIVQQKMLDAIMWYKESLSPMMPPNCRFLPTCSSYGLEAIEEFGPWKGGILTAWRIFRCNPSGGSGYDPPRWPPPGYFAGTTSWVNRK